MENPQTELTQKDTAEVNTPPPLKEVIPVKERPEQDSYEQKVMKKTEEKYESLHQRY